MNTLYGLLAGFSCAALMLSAIYAGAARLAPVRAPGAVKVGVYTFSVGLAVMAAYFSIALGVAVTNLLNGVYGPL